jgi:hypothetical protein
VQSGQSIIISLLLSSTGSQTGPVSVTDSAGNLYTVDSDSNDGGDNDRMLVISSLKALALPAGGTITLTFPSSPEYHVSADVYSGIAARDQKAAATGKTSPFSSGSTAATTQASELVVGVVGVESGGSPAWSAGFTALPVQQVSTDYLDQAYQTVSQTGQYAATGTASGTWMAAVVTYTAG